MSFKVKLILTYIFLIIVVIFFSAFFTKLYISRSFNQIIIRETPSGFKMFMTPHGERFLNAMKLVLLWVGIISILIGSALAFFVSKLTVNPIKKMVKFSKKIEKGDYSARINAKTKDEIGQLARALDHMAEHLSEIEKMRKTLVQNVSHDLRTPLTVINGYLETLDNKDFTKEEKEKSLKIIKGEVERMESMLNELSVLSALDGKKYKLNLKKINLNDFIIETSEMIRIEANKKNLFVKINKNSKPIYINADRKRIKEIFLNLLDNAIKYTDKGGIYIKNFQEGTNAIISIKDTGKGMPEQELPYIFDRFYRGEKSRSRTTGGLGIGLTIIKELIYAHNGKIKVKSELGKGTEFILSFPVLKASRVKKQ